MGEYNLINVISNQYEETHDPQRNNVATTVNCFKIKKVSPENLAESENLVEAA